jgi:murein DD-endopeptidase MepM/ murein hydrolase activator NlpD
MTTTIDNFALQDGRRWTLDTRQSAVHATRSTQHATLSSEKKVAEEFASLMLMEMLKAMRATLSEEGPDGQPSTGRSTYTSLADVEVTRALAKRDGIGLASFIERALEKVTKTPVHAESPQVPVTGVVSSEFGVRSDPLDGDERFHAGVDIAAPAGSPVTTVAAGKVVFSGWANGYGNLIAIDHGNGVVTRYAHTQESLVTEGQHVVAGQEVARVGSSGRSTGPHLHFEVRQDGEPVDPRVFLSRSRS